MQSSIWALPIGMAVFTPLLIWALRSGRKKNVSPDVDGRVTLRPPMTYAIFGWFSSVLPLFFSWGTFALIRRGFLSGWTFGDFGLCGVLLLIAVITGALSIHLIRSGRQVVVYDNEGIRVSMGNGSATSAFWSEITKASIQPVSSYVILHLKNGQLIKLNPYLVGAEGLFSAFREKTTIPIDLIIHAVDRT